MNEEYEYVEGYWFGLWVTDRQDMQKTRIKNVIDDINAGYSPFSNEVTKGIGAVEFYEDEYNRAFIGFSHMSISEIDAWCKKDLKERGAIE